MMDDDDLAQDLASASSWDIATRYHEFKSKPAAKRSPELARSLRRLSAQAILDRAQAVMGSVVHPVARFRAPLAEVPGSAEQVDLDLEETLENSALLLRESTNAAAGAPLSTPLTAPLSANDVWMDYSLHQPQSVILSVDTSLSMTGEKLALTAVALAVVLLQFPEDPVGIIAFENDAMIIKHPREHISIGQLVERFLDVPAQGYTHLEAGLKASLALAQAAEGVGRPPSTVLLTDGKYTAGRDPSYLGPRFSHLVVLKMGRERASAELCRDLARGGRGVVREVGELEALPAVMYGVVKDLLRGRSQS